LGILSHQALREPDATGTAQLRQAIAQLIKVYIQPANPFNRRMQEIKRTPLQNTMVIWSIDETKQ
jgi:hypothetical protein